MPTLPSTAATCQPHPSGGIVSVHQPSVSPPLSSAHVILPSPSVSSPPAAEPGSQQMVAMFDKVLSLCTASLATRHKCPPQPRHSHGHHSTHRTSCRVCGSNEHTTHVHCKLYKLCHNCFDPGHMRRECPQTRQNSNMLVPSPTNAALN